MYENFFRRCFQFKKSSDFQSRRLPAQFFSAEKLKRSSLKKIEVLLADDHQIMRECLRRVTNNHDDIVIVDEATNGKEAVELAREHRPDIIVMDVNMPVMNGIEATREITSNLSQVCVIGLSTNEKSTIIEEMKSAGASAYIQKSEAFELLIRTIRTEASAY